MVTLHRALNPCKWYHIAILTALVIMLAFKSIIYEGVTKHTDSHKSISDWLNNEDSKVQQDDPVLVRFVRENHIFPANQLPYRLNNNNNNPSSGQLQSVLALLRNDSGGFFVEAGANDGEWGTNTLYLERKLGWNGLLVEASPSTFQKLVKKNRKAWHSNAALSMKPRPMLATFYENPDVSVWGGLTYRFYHKSDQQVQVQCIPLYTLLLALNRTEVDFLSLDLEGAELDVLRTVPFDKINIKAIAVEVINGKEGPEPVKELMSKNGYHLHDTVSDLGDLIFINEELHQLKIQKASKTP